MFENKNTNIDTSNLHGHSFEVGPFRPPSEGASASLLLRLTENCPWNKCAFCSLYKDGKFAFRSVEDIKKDVDEVKAISDGIKEISCRLGEGGKVSKKVLHTIGQSDPALGMDHCYVMVAHWLHVGAKTAFLQDSNSLVMPPSELVEVLGYLRKTFPTLERVTSYARSHTLYHRTKDQLRAIHQSGLDRLHVGLETGDDELLKKIKKGATSDQQIQGGKKAKEAAFELSEYFMTDLGGRDMWEQHARNTARVLSEIDPDYIRSRPLVPIPGTIMYQEYERGELKLSSPHERLHELRLMVEGLEFTGRLVFDHFNNSWRNRNGGSLFSGDHEGYRFPREKKKVQELIQEGLSIDESLHIDAEYLIRNLIL